MYRFAKLAAVSVMISLVFFVAISFAQQMPSASMLQKDKQSVPVGFGATIIDGQLWYLVNIAPELSFGKLGIGLDLNLRYGPADSAKKSIRAQDFDEFYDFLRIIRYVRWAQKGDPFYIRLGRLDYSRLGHGFIMYNYRNSSSYDLRRMGVELDIDFDKFGFETVYGDFAGRGVLGMRGYARPLQYTSAADIPIIGNLETGMTYAMDFHRDANRLFNSTNNTTDEKGSMGIFGLDLGLPLLSMPMIKSTIYMDYAKIVGYGNGLAMGISFDFSGMGLFTAALKYERRWMGDQFLPAYFNALYERDRIVKQDSVRFMSKAMELNAVTKSQGYYGEILVSILNTINVVGGYQAPVGVSNAGILHLELQTGNALPILVSGGYDKKNIGPLFTLDNNSVLNAQIGYKPYPFLLVSMLYEWTWTEEKDASGNVIGFKEQKRIEPKVSFVINF